MEIRESKEGDVLVLAPDGGLASSDDCAALEQKLAGAVKSGVRSVVVDCASVTQLTGPAIRALLLASRKLARAKGGVVLCGMTARVQKAFSISGFDREFTVAASRDEALRRALDWTGGPPAKAAPAARRSPKASTPAAAPAPPASQAPADHTPPVPAAVPEAPAANVATPAATPEPASGSPPASQVAPADAPREGPVAAPPPSEEASLALATVLLLALGGEAASPRVEPAAGAEQPRELEEAAIRLLAALPA